MIASSLADVTRAQLAPEDRERVERSVASGAAAGAYGAMALWALNAMTVEHEATGRLAEAAAGVSLGLLGGAP